MAADKKSQILAAATKCFSEKGFRATSIQDIADQLDMAKGSLYFYFKSKEDVLLSIFRQYTDDFLRQLQIFSENDQMPPRERLIGQILLRFELLEDNQEFITLLMRDRFEMTEDIFSLMQSLRVRMLWSNQLMIETIYGDEVKPYSCDAANILNSLVDAYTNTLVLDQVPLNLRELADFIGERLDDLVAGMIKRQVKPRITFDDMVHF
ncbi:MAG: TetR/AcrR family transcriptional regulator, partial [Gorillibacterium sp.]|nr:TetR/AcrR family transcriptional regulator [Gorillibacterium sp.]